MRRQFRKVPILASASNHPEDGAVKLVKDYLTNLGFHDVRVERKKHLKNSKVSASSVIISYRYNPYSDSDAQRYVDWLTRNFPDEYPTSEYTAEAVQLDRDDETGEYHNFELLQELYGDADAEDSRGGYSTLDEALIEDVRRMLNREGYTDVTLTRKVSGLQTQFENLSIVVSMPISEEIV